MDVPAAHSMDTTWWAVDRDGHVARCFTGEVGPLPLDAFHGEWWKISLELAVVRILAACDAGPRDAIACALVEQIAAGDTDARAILLDHREGRGLAPGGWTPHARGIYRIDDGIRPIALEEAPEDVLGIFIFESGWFGEEALDEAYGLPHAKIDSITRAELAQLWETSDLLQAFVVDGEQLPEARDAGFFEYHHDWGYDAYARDPVPARPLAFDALPAPMRERIARLRLTAVAFADEAALSPDDHVACHTWGEG